MSRLVQELQHAKLGRLAGIAERPVRRIGSSRRSEVDSIAVEEPLEIRIDGETVAVTMRTPGDDVRLTLGFLFAEGLIRSAADVGSISHCGRPGTDGYGNIIDVRSAGGAHVDVMRVLDSRRWNVTASACGVCGRQSIDDLLQRCRPVEADVSLPAVRIFEAVDQLREQQRNFAQTGGLHGAAIFDRTGVVLACHEDVGRHNAVDKAIGRLVQEPPSSRPALLVVSGRASFEIIQKAVIADIPVVASVSAASSLAIDLAEACRITLVSFVRGHSLNIYTHAQRIVSDV